MKNIYSQLINLLSSTYTNNNAAYRETQKAVNSLVKATALTGDTSLLTLTVDDFINASEIFEVLPEEIINELEMWKKWCLENNFLDHLNRLNSI